MTLTVLDALTKSNPTVDNSRSKEGPNTAVHTAVHSTSWRPWIDFRYDVLSKVFKEQLKKTSFSDSDATNWSYYEPEYAVISWSSSGRSSNKLTVKPALWFLAMIAIAGDRSIDYTCPPLDSWRRHGRGFIHNSSGAKKNSLDNGDCHCEPGQGGGVSSGPAADGPSATPESPGYYDGAPEIDEEEQPQYSQQEAAASRGAADDDVYGAGGGGGGEDDDYEDEEDDDDETQVPVPKRKVVALEKHRLVGGYYFRSSKGAKKNTERKDWTKVDDGYELPGRKHVYFVPKLPRDMN